MSNEIRKRSPAEWFLESFFQERNIKWMLALGVMIVFGSSLMLVTRQWESWSVVWKALAVIGYSGAVFGCGELAFCRLGLRNTGTVMRSLTLLLLPLSFFAINRLGMTSLPMQIGLLVLDAGLTAFAARRIFAEFLRGPQPTLVASYVALAVAGGVLTPLSGIAAPIAALIQWAVFSVGAVKSARQVFWLAEEHMRPRVFGFVPILLLGTQFLTLFVLNCAGEFSLPWIGLGCVLFAVPVLLTTDVIAKVFQQRTGDLVRPLPWSIVLPLFVGQVLCITGVGLAAIPLSLLATPLSARAGYVPSLFSMALTPAAGLAALMLLVTARRTRHSAFVWAGLIGVAVAYQASPAFFIETAKNFVNSAATAVHEQRLPVAFYGLTWLPLILGSTFVAVRAARQGDTLLERSCRRFAIGVAMLLFAISFTNGKAIFPVAAAMALTFGVQAVVFGSRRLKFAAALAWTALTCSSQFFAASVVGWSMTDDVHRLVMLAGAAVLLLRTLWCESRAPLWSLLSFKSFPRNESDSKDEKETRNSINEFGIVSLVHTIVVAAMWLAIARPESAMSLSMVGGIAGSGFLLVHAWKWLKPGLGVFSLAALLAVIAKSTVAFAPNDDWVLLTWTLATLAMWFVGQSLAVCTSRFAEAFGRSSLRVSVVGLMLLTVTSQLLLWVTNVGITAIEANSWFVLLPAVITTMWLFDVARRESVTRSISKGECFTGIGIESGLERSPSLTLRVTEADRTWRMTFTVMGCNAVLMLIGSVLIGAKRMSLVPTVWAGLAFMAVTLLRVRYRAIPTASLGPIAMPVRVISMAVLVLTSVVTLFVQPFAMWTRLAGLIGVGGLLLESVWPNKSRDEHKGPLDGSLMLSQWQVAMLVATAMAPSLQTLGDLFGSAALPAALPVALTMATGLTVRRLWRSGRGDEAAGIHTALSITVIAYGLLAAAVGSMSAISIGSAVMAIATFAILMAGEFVLAVRRQRVDGVWMAQGIVGAAVAWLFVAGVISIGHGFSMFACTGAAVIWLVIAKLCETNSRLAFAADAFRAPANLLPIMAVVIGIGRHVTAPPQGGTTNLGMNSLALLMSAAYYFWRGMESRECSPLSPRAGSGSQRESESGSEAEQEANIDIGFRRELHTVGSRREPATVERDYFIASAAILNVALGLLWRELRFSDPQFFMIPAGLTVLWLVELLKREIPESYRDPLRYAGALTILVSPTFHIVSGSWLHLMSLMVCSVLVALLAIGLRLRALIYSGTAFLIADLVAMVIRGSIDHPNLLWLAGLAVGASVITLGAICENHRERLLTRLRVLTAELQSWN